MAHYQILARKYRPQKFCDVVGQTLIVTTLKNAIRMNRTAYAYLFAGSRGTGKTTLARLFAKALNCATLSDLFEPCNHCSSCQEIAAGHAVDVLEIDGASHRGIEDIRQINETVAFAPAGKRYKIYLIDEVHMLTKEAFNALLKTLEEPPSHVKFFFCTTEPHRIPLTILSRCQRFNLNRLSLEEVETKLGQIALVEEIKVEREVLTLIAKRAEGSLRDALSLFDQMITFNKEALTVPLATEWLSLPSKEIFLTLDRAGAARDLKAAFKIAATLFSSGISLPYFLEELISHYRALLLFKQGIEKDSFYQESASYYTSEQLISILEFLIEGQQNFKTTFSERTSLEMLLLKIVQSHHQLSLESLVNRLYDLEKALSTSEDISPKAEELPEKPKIQVIPQAAPIKEQSRFDTIMRFAAKELNASLKKE